MRDEVYCEECKWVSIMTNAGSKRCECMLNLKFIGNYYDRSLKKEYKRWASEINKRNRCKWFMRKDQ